jgi:hypothetical protein
MPGDRSQTTTLRSSGDARRKMAGKLRPVREEFPSAPQAEENKGLALSKLRPCVANWRGRQRVDENQRLRQSYKSFVPLFQHRGRVSHASQRQFIALNQVATKPPLASSLARRLRMDLANDSLSEKSGLALPLTEGLPHLRAISPEAARRPSPRHTPATTLSPISSRSHLLTPAGGSFLAPGPALPDVEGR